MKQEGLIRLVESLGWSGATRDDAAVAHKLMQRETPDGIYTLDAATISDTFFHWLDQTGAIDEVRALQGHDIKRHSAAFELLLMTYFMRVMCRVKSMNSLPEVLFADRSLMLRLGFNAQQLEHGLTQRGSNRQGVRTNLPLDPEMLTNTILKLDEQELRHAVETCLHVLWQTVPQVPQRLMVIIDGTFIEPGPSTKGGAYSTRKKTITTALGPKEEKTIHYGFKLIWAQEVSTGLPLGFAFALANEDERAFVNRLLDTTQQILAGRGTVHTLLIDAGYFSGVCLHELDQRGLTFITPASKSAAVWQEAYTAAQAPAASGLTCHTAKRTRTVRRRNPDGGPLVSHQERLTVVGIEGLQTFETYAPREKVKDHRHVDRHKKSFTCKSINGVVVTQRTGSPRPEFVLLTNGPVTAPLSVYDNYDDRSLIENRGNRSLKQDWHLQHPPQRSKKGAEIHCYVALCAFACAMAHMLYLDAQQQLIDTGKPSTLGDYLRQIRRMNRDRVIIFYRGVYGIFYASELLLLFDFPVVHPNQGAAATKDELLALLEHDKTR